MLEKPITTIDEYINFSEAINKILNEIPDEEDYFIEKVYGDTIEAYYYYAYDIYRSKQFDQIEKVKIQGLEKVVHAIRKNLPKKVPNSFVNKPYGVLFYNSENGELSVSFHIGQDSNYLEEARVNKNIHFQLIRRVVSLDEIETWVYAVNGVIGYECCSEII